MYKLVAILIVVALLAFGFYQSLQPARYRIDVDSIEVVVVNDDNEMVSDIEADVRARYQTLEITVSQERGVEFHADWYVAPMEGWLFPQALTNEEFEQAVLPFDITLRVVGLVYVSTRYEFEGEINRETQTIVMTEEFSESSEYGNRTDRHTVQVTAHLIRN